MGGVYLKIFQAQAFSIQLGVGHSCEKVIFSVFIFLLFYLFIGSICKICLGMFVCSVTEGGTINSYFCDHFLYWS